MILPRPERAIARLSQLPRAAGRVEMIRSQRTLELIIDNPGRAGAIDPGMMLDFAALPDELAEQAPVAVVVHSTSPVGRAFCAGGDLKAVRRHLMDAEAAGDMCDLMSWVLQSLVCAPCVVLAAVEGPALGGGAEILTACDVIYAGPAARVGFVHARLGVSPGWGGGQRLLKRVGHRDALWWLTEARPVNAAEALAHGMLDRIVPDGQALLEARAHARRLAELPRAAVQGAVRLASGADICERELFLSLWGGAEHRQALAASRAGR